jgi:hypothetical protein
VNIFSPDLPPGLPEMPFLNAIASTSYSIGAKEYFAVGSVHAVVLELQSILEASSVPDEEL